MLLAIQELISEEIKRRLSVIAEVEAEVGANLKRTSRLRQSILKRAFEGKLVPQDPAEEPASELLERIRTERERVTTGRRKKSQGGKPRRKLRSGFFEGLRGWSASVLSELTALADRVDERALGVLVPVLHLIQRR